MQLSKLHEIQRKSSANCIVTAKRIHGHLDIKRYAGKLRSLMSIPAQFPNVTAIAKANIYFDGKVVSHAILLASGEKKTLGLIYAGKFHFGTDKAERMEIVAGACSVKLDGESTVISCSAGSTFEVPAKSGFDIEVADSICEYVCSFLD